MDEKQRTIPAARMRPLRMAAGWGAAALFAAAIVGGTIWIDRARPQRAAAKTIWFEAPEMKAAAPLITRLEVPAAGAKAPAAAITTGEKRAALGQLARVDRLVRDYRRAYGEFPVGSNVDITRTLRGDNEKKIIFVTPEEMPIGPRGELLDTWHTPYFFHQISGTHMEIMSAGPDRQMWTADDLKVAAQ